MHTATLTTLPWRADDGGRADAGYRGTAGDCVTRALAIATGEPYADVYRALAAGTAAAGGRRSARNGVHSAVYGPWLTARGWEYISLVLGGPHYLTAAGPVPTEGAVLVWLKRHHLVAVVDGVIRDTWDASQRGGRLCPVGGFWTPVR